MKSLYDIVHNDPGASEPGIESLAVSSRAGFRFATAAVLGATLGASKASKFAEGAADLVTDKQFLGELEGEIGLPRSGESEDEFVARAKETMFEMLQSKLK